MKGIEWLIGGCTNLFNRPIRIYNTISFPTSFLIVPSSKKARSTVYRARDKSVRAVQDAAFAAVEDILKKRGPRVVIPLAEQKICRRHKLPSIPRAKRTFYRAVRLPDNTCMHSLWLKLALKTDYRETQYKARDGLWTVKCVYRRPESYASTTLARHEDRRKALRRATMQMKLLVADQFDLEERINFAVAVEDELDKRAQYKYFKLSSI